MMVDLPELSSPTCASHGGGAIGHALCGIARACCGAIWWSTHAENPSLRRLVAAAKEAAEHAEQAHRAARVGALLSGCRL